MTLRWPSNDDVVSTPSEPPALAIVNAFVYSNNEKRIIQKTENKKKTWIGRAMTVQVSYFDVSYFFDFYARTSRYYTY